MAYKRRKRTKTCKKSVQDVDYISQLPESVICEIISRLSLRDAVKTSSLSRRWINVCLCLSRVKFNWNSMFLDDNEHPCAHSHSKEKFVRAVTQFLQFYSKGAKLHMLSFELEFCLGEDKAEDIDQWVQCAIRMGAQKVSLQNLCNKFLFEVNQDSQRGSVKGRCNLGAKIFEGAHLRLTQLSLVYCFVPQDLSTAVSQLETLFLAFVPLAKYDLQSLLFCMAKLKHLQFIKCDLPEELNLQSLLCLRCFSVYFCSGIKYIGVSNPYLATFSYATHQGIRYDLSRVPNLSSFGFSLHPTESLDTLARIQECLPKLKNLSVSTTSTANWLRHLPGKIATFCHVRVLQLHFPKGTDFCFLKLTTFLRAFPCMRKLQLISCGEEFEQGKLELGRCSHKSLEEIELRACHVSKSIVELALLLLRFAAALKRLVIKKALGYCKCRKKQLENEGERLKLLKQLQGIRPDVCITIQCEYYLVSLLPS